MGSRGVSIQGSTSIGFTPHMITVQAGEDVLANLMSFSQNKARYICIMSANGAISTATLGRATSAEIVTYEGLFEILSLSGLFVTSECGGLGSIIGGFTVALAGPDGSVLGGCVVGPLTAATPVQVTLGSFVACAKQTKSGQDKVVTAPKPGKPLN